MQLSQTMLLASILLFLSLADATPLIHKRTLRKFVSFPVKRCHYEPKDLHPLIVAEQHANRALQRLARMSGSPAIPREILERNLMRRVLEIEGPAGLEKRFNRRNLDDTVDLDKRFNPFDGSISAPSIDKSLAAGDEVSITKANPPTAKNSLGLDIEGHDISYLATIQIGTPARDFSILLDSGSADFWVGSENCVSNDRGCGNHVFLGSKSSTSFNDSGVPWNINYFSGSVNGTKVKDDVSIAGLDIVGMSFGVADFETKELSDTRFDGLMGLARSKLSNQDNPVSVEVLANAGLIDNAIVSYKLGRSKDKENDGEVTFGGLDPNKFVGTPVTINNVNNIGFWAGNLQNVKVDGESLGLQRPAIFDSGTTLILLPDEDAVTIHKKIPGSKRVRDSFTIPCNTKTVVSLTFGNSSFEIDPRDLAFVQSGDGSCVSGIRPGATPNDEWLLGDVFLKNVYISNNFEENTISLAKVTRT